MNFKPPRRSFLDTYRDAIVFNRNLIIAATGGFIASTIVSQLYSLFDSSKFGDSLIALVTDYLVYLPVFGFLFYLDNRQKYIDQSGKRNGKLIKEDLKKLFAAFSVSEVIYAIARISAQYQLLSSYSQLQPFQASMIGELIAWTIFFLSINLMTKAVKLFRKS